MKKSVHHLWIWTSLFFAFFASWPQMIDKNLLVFLFSYCLWALIFGVEFLIGWILIKIIRTQYKKYRSILIHTTTDKQKEQLVFYDIFALAILTWIPAFLAFFPGTFGADAPRQLAMFNGDLPFTTHHPWLHTLLIGILINTCQFLFHNPNMGVGLYIFFFQIVFCAYALSKAMLYLYRKGLNPWILFGTSFLMAISPFSQMLVNYTTKDIPYAAALLLFIVSICEVLFPAKPVPSKSIQNKAEKGKDRHPTLTSVLLSQLATSKSVISWGILMCLLRNQGLYLVVIGFVVLFVVYSKTMKKRALKLFMVSQICIILAAWILTSLVPSLAGIAISNPREMLALPIHQIAFELNRNHGSQNKFLSPEDEQQAYSYFDNFQPENLDPYSADNSKDLFDNEKFSKNPGAFFLLYLRFLFKNPLGILQSAAYLTAPYFDMRYGKYNALSVTTSYEDYASQKGITSSSSLLPGYQDWLRDIAIRSSYRTHCPFWLRLFDPGITLYFLIFMLGYAIFCKNTFAATACIYPILYVLTMMLGPVSLLRYSFIYAFEWPFLFGVLLLCITTSKKRRCNQKTIKQTYNLT
ncbi:hypothetical protein IM774_07760 [Erysipelotrichaceae bacterium RD49]|nr:hypothetical protein [Erysipelotrichaceae bacterium RD49]